MSKQKSGDTLISVNERAFIEKVLNEQKLRVDGRGIYDVRTIKVTTLPGTPGKAEVQLGTSRYLTTNLLIHNKFKYLPNC